MSEGVKVAVIIPARDEERAVGDVVREVVETLSAHADFRPYQVLVVDDGSSDQTAAVAREAGATVLPMGVGSGYGAAVKRALRETQAEFCCLLDADGSYPASALPSLLAALAAGAEQAIGARVTPGAQVPRLRRPAKWVITKLAAALVGKPIPDLNSGMRAFRRSRVAPIVPLLPDGFSLTTTLTVASLLGGWSVAWVPIPYHRRLGRSKFKAVRDTSRLLLSLARSIVYFDPLRLFLPLTVGLGTCAVAFGVWDVFWEKNLTDKTVLTTLSALEVFMLGLLADLLVKRR